MKFLDQPPRFLFFTGKGGVGKTTLAAVVAAELARRGLPVHLTTSDPAAHLAETLNGSLDTLTVTRIDPQAETEHYRQHVMAIKGAQLDSEGRALLEEDLRSPCTEEIAVFRAFARTVAQGQEGFVVIDTAPTGHTLLLLDAAEAYHRQVSQSMGEVPEEVRRLLPRLRDGGFSPVLVVALPAAPALVDAALGALAADQSRRTDDGRQFLQVFGSPWRMAVIGAVHIAQALVPMAQLLGYEVTVVDPRRAWATP